MKNVINSRDIVKDLEDKGLVVDDSKQFNFYIKNFNYNTVILNYSDVFYLDENKKKYDPEANSSHLIALYKFDHDLGNHILRYILVIEKMLNTNVAYEIINEFHITDRCLFKINEKFIIQNILPNFNSVETHLSPKLFIHSWIKYCSTNKITKKYYNPNGRDEMARWENCPLDIMCLTWSFSTTFSIFLALTDRVRNRIINNFRLYPSQLKGFSDFLKNVLNIRNLISHNYPIYNCEVKYQSPELFEIYNSIFNTNIDHISVMNMVELIEYFAFNKTLVSNTKYYFKKMQVPEKFKARIEQKLNK